MSEGAFVRLRRESGNVLYAQITSAAVMAKDHQDALVKKLADKSGKRVEADFKIDTTLIGGVKVAFDPTLERLVMA